jgi:REP element-mobilizing transposase RayT
MSQPRSIVSGATYLLTRRTLRRHLLLRPDAAITQLIVYALAVSARRYGVLVHAICAMSTHLHLVVTDSKGMLPRFLHHFHRLVALGTKVLRSWEGPVWDHEPTSVVRLMTRESVVEKIAYTLANPVAAGLVRLAHEWPGAKVLVAEIGRAELRASRPDVYFDPSNRAWPEVATLPVTLPPDVAEGEAEEFRRAVASSLARQEEEAREEAQRRGVRFLGAKRAVAVPPHERASSFEALRHINPTFAVGHGNGDARHRAVVAIRGFRSAYRDALKQWCAGVRSVVFPEGTWWMHVLHAVTVVGMTVSAT